MDIDIVKHTDMMGLLLYIIMLHVLDGNIENMPQAVTISWSPTANVKAETEVRL